MIRSDQTRKSKSKNKDQTYNTWRPASSMELYLRHFSSLISSDLKSDGVYRKGSLNSQRSMIRQDNLKVKHINNI